MLGSYHLVYDDYFFPSNSDRRAVSGNAHPLRGNARPVTESSARHGNRAYRAHERGYILAAKPAKPATVWLPSRWRWTCPDPPSYQRRALPELVTRAAAAASELIDADLLLNSLAAERYGNAFHPHSACQRVRRLLTGTRREPHTAAMTPP